MTAESNEPIHALLSQLITMIKNLDDKLSEHINKDVAVFKEFADSAFIDGNPHLHKLTHMTAQQQDMDARKDRRTLRLKLTEVGLIATLVFIAQASWKEVIANLAKTVRNL